MQDLLTVVLGLAQVGLLTAIFMRLGYLTKGHEEHARRLDKLEGKEPCCNP